MHGPYAALALAAEPAVAAKSAVPAALSVWLAATGGDLGRLGEYRE